MPITDQKAWQQLQDSENAHGITHFAHGKRRVIAKGRGESEIVVLGTPSNNTGIQMQLGDSGIFPPTPGKAV